MCFKLLCKYYYVYGYYKQISYALITCLEYIFLHKTYKSTKNHMCCSRTPAYMETASRTLKSMKKIMLFLIEAYHFLPWIWWLVGYAVSMYGGPLKPSATLRCNFSPRRLYESGKWGKIDYTSYYRWLKQRLSWSYSTMYMPSGGFMLRPPHCVPDNILIGFNKAPLIYELSFRFSIFW